MMNASLLLALFLLPAFLSGQPFQLLNHQIGLVDTIGGEPIRRPEFGCGISFADFNGDGWDDLSFATGLGRPCLFYQNNGNGTFTKVFPTGSIADQLTETTMIIWVDFDNDGDQDCYISSNYEKNKLHRNNGNFDFTDITIAAGLPQINDRSFGTAVGDYNNDGYLDIYITY